jgi:hypothetical protein
MELFSFKFKSKKFILSSLLLMLVGGTIINLNPLKLIAIVITIILISGLLLKNKKKLFDNEIPEVNSNEGNVDNEKENNNINEEKENHYNLNEEKEHHHNLDDDRNNNHKDDNKNHNNKDDNINNNKKDDNNYKYTEDKKQNKENEKPKHKLNIKENIKKNKDYRLNHNYTDYTENPYQTDIKNLHNKYISKDQNYNFELKVNQSLCSTPIFNLRTIKSLNFYWNFVIHNFDNKKLNNLIMCRDIHKWMDNSTLSNDDLEDDFCPIYYITKNNNSENAEIVTFEYLKVFIHTDKDGTKNAFIQKGLDYSKIEKYINELIDNEIIKDLLFDSNYFNYNLSTHEGVTQFLDGLLSLILPPESTIGDTMILDVKHNCENKNAYEFMYNTLNIDSNTFNTTI